MPIYEFYCKDCHRIFNFFSHRVNTEARPLCPKCGRVELVREPSRFATLRQAGSEPPDGLEGADSSRIEGAMESVLGEMEQLGDDPNPAQLGRMMRRLGEASGLEMGPKMEQIVRRLEAGEDPDRLEDEIGDPLEGETGPEENMEEFFRLRKKARLGARRKPEVDETLYQL